MEKEYTFILPCLNEEKTLEYCIKEIQKTIEEKNLDAAKAQLRTTMADLDKCSSKGLIKKNTCDRQKARLNKKVKEMI
mgnify:CR=1 FL=1